MFNSEGRKEQKIAREQKNKIKGPKKRTEIQKRKRDDKTEKITKRTNMRQKQTKKEKQKNRQQNPNEKEEESKNITKKTQDRKRLENSRSEE